MAGQSTDEEKNVFTFLMVQAYNIEVPFMVDDTFLVTSLTNLRTYELTKKVNSKKSVRAY